MQSMAMQTKKNEQAAVLSLVAPSLYWKRPSWMGRDEHDACGEEPLAGGEKVVCGSQSTDLHPVWSRWHLGAVWSPQCGPRPACRCVRNGVVNSRRPPRRSHEQRCRTWNYLK